MQAGPDGFLVVRQIKFETEYPGQEISRAHGAQQVSASKPAAVKDLEAGARLKF